MKKAILLSTGIMILGGYLSAQAPKAIPDQYIIVLKESVAKPVVKGGKQNKNREQKVKDNQAARDQNLAKVKNLQTKKNIKESAVLFNFADVLVGFSANLSKTEAESLRSDPDVGGVYQDFEISLGPFQPQDVAAQGLVTCAVSTAGGPVDGSSKTNWIWILDTGIDLDHPDLNVQTNPTYAISFVGGKSANDGNGHGTHVAGIAAAKDNTIGSTGVSSGAKVVPVKVLGNNGSGSWSSFLAGLNHVATYDSPGDVVNMSLGAYPVSNCPSYYPTIITAIQNLGNAGTYVCIAAGNDNGDANSNFPGCVNGNNVFTVGAINCDKTCASYSNFSAIVVDWVAVGSGVYSSYKNGGYATLSGTSMATPVVAGIIHARGGPPVSGGVVNCKGTNYNIARR